ncbi:MAG: hypothetical protein K1X88_04070 [Nannocystaceae bacterium]|nr:hypothetical protein [Nannocystaceae bacterium]
MLRPLAGVPSAFATAAAGLARAGERQDAAARAMIEQPTPQAAIASKLATADARAAAAVVRASDELLGTLIDTVA